MSLFAVNFRNITVKVGRAPAVAVEAKVSRTPGCSSGEVTPLPYTQQTAAAGQQGSAGVQTGTRRDHHCEESATT